MKQQLSGHQKAHHQGVDGRVGPDAGHCLIACIAYRLDMNDAVVAWVIMVVLLLVMVLLGATLATRRQARRASHRDRRLRMAKRAVRRAGNESRRTRRPTLRGEGTGVDTPENFAAG
jgi:hypothetical protein